MRLKCMPVFLNNKMGKQGKKKKTLISPSQPQANTFSMNNFIILICKKKNYNIYICFVLFPHFFGYKKKKRSKYSEQKNQTPNRKLKTKQKKRHRNKWLVQNRGYENPKWGTK